MPIKDNRRDSDDYISLCAACHAAFDSGTKIKLGDEDDLSDELLEKESKLPEEEPLDL